MIKKLLLLFRGVSLAILGLYFLLYTPKVFGQAADVTKIHTDYNGYWTTGFGTRPDLENNLIGFDWKGKTYSTGVDDATLNSKVSNVSVQKFRALKIQSLNYTGSTYFLQGSMMDGSASGRALTPAFIGGPNLKAELASRLTDGKNGLSLGTGIANIDKGDVYFKIGTDNLVLGGLNDGIPDLIVTQVAQPGGADTFKFVDASGATVGNGIVVDFSSVTKVGSYSLDLFNANNGAIAGSFVPGELRDIRILGYDISAFGIDGSNAAKVDRFVVSFSGSSDCAFIAFNAKTLKKSELSLVKKGKLMGCGLAGDKINYTFDVTNSGEVPIKNIVVADPLPGIIISGTQGYTLNPGETKQLTGIYTITAADVAAGMVTNSAKVTGLDISDAVVEDISGQTDADDNATIISLITAPTAITGATTICKGDSTTLTASGGSVVSGAIIEWYTGSCGGTLVGTGNSITVNPNVDTTYFVKYQSSCNTNCASQKVTVNPVLTPSVSISANPAGAICAGTNVTFTASPTNGGTSPKYQWKSGGSNISGATASTYSSSTLTNGEVISVVLTSNASCLTATTATSNVLTMVVNALPAAPLVGAITKPDCVTPKGSVVLNGLPTSGIVYQTGTSSNSYTISNTTKTMTIAGLAVGTYNFSVSNGSCTSSSSSTVTINPVVTKKWTGGNWLPAGAPTSSDIVIFEDHATITA
ncbi:DUF7507 domain-containing protein, partial [Flavobacterium sp.]|uniref:DUF7507 domain-containing protein n=1 Tax=Flavobacterium sp. TaxID=239 RepID=UPI002C8435FD|nr:hypothetical protein [Flavobacterium sp.]